MNRKLAALALGAVVLAGACSNNDGAAVSDPTLAPSTTSDEQAMIDKLPTDTKVVPVTLATPADPNAPIDVNTLPESVRSMIPAANTEKARCIANTAKATLDADPSIVHTNGKIASMMGQAAMKCGGKQATEGIAEILKGSGLTEAQAACLEKELNGNQAAASMLVSALLSFDTDTIAKAFAPYEAKCNFKWPPQ